MHRLLTFVVLFTYFLSESQEKKQSFPVITLRTNPLSFAEEDAGVTLGVGMQWNRRWSVNIDPTFIFYSPYHLDNTSSNFPDSHEKARGIKIRGSITYYFRDYIYGKRGWFGALEFHYKKVSATKWADFGMNCVNGQCDFYEHAPYNEIKTEEGIAAKMGWLCRLWSPRWAAEFYTGIGFKFSHVTQRNQPAGGSFLSSPNEETIFAAGQDVYPMFPIGVKLVYRIF